MFHFLGENFLAKVSEYLVLPKFESVRLPVELKKVQYPDGGGRKHLSNPERNFHWKNRKHLHYSGGTNLYHHGMQKNQLKMTPCDQHHFRKLPAHGRHLSRPNRRKSFQ